MDANDFFQASGSKKIRLLLESIKNEEKKKRDINILTLSSIEQINLVVDQINNRQKIINEINPITANWSEQIKLLINSIRIKIQMEFIEKINFYELLKVFAEGEKDLIFSYLKDKGLSQAEINNLLDDVSPILKNLKNLNSKIEALNDKLREFGL